jgi:OOP family OmpA-OmpF porin
MKKLFVAAVLFASTSAYAEGAYVTASAGSGKSSYDCTGTSSCKLNDTVYKLGVGYKFNQNFSIEGVYFDLGKVDATVDTGFGSATGTIKSSGYGVRGLVSMPFSDNFSGFVTLGINQAQSKIDVALGNQSGGESENSTQVSASLGVDYAFSETVALRAEVESHRFKDIADQNYRIVSGTVGLKISF